MALPNPGMDAVPFTALTAEFLDDMIENIESLDDDIEAVADGSGLAADAVDDANLIYGKLRSRQGGSATDWSTSGTNTYDYSAVNTFYQTGTIAVTTDNFVVTFPTAFNQVPNVLCSMRSASGANCYVICTARTATTATFRVMGSDASVKTSETIVWLAIGE